MGEDILREFARYRNRHQWVRGLDLFLEAAFVMTVTAAGMLLGVEDGLARLGVACRANDVPLVCDEIATGFGRTGT